MDVNSSFAIDVRQRFGKKVLQQFFAEFGHISRDHWLKTPEQYTAFLLECYERDKASLAAGKMTNPRYAGWNAEDIFLEFTKAYIEKPLLDMGMAAAWQDADFSRLYRAAFDALRLSHTATVGLYLRHYKVYRESLTFSLLNRVLACHALNRADLADRFFPPEFGFFDADSHAELRQIANLIMALRLGDEEWIGRMAGTARDFLAGKKRGKYAQAMIGFLLTLVARDPAGMSAQLLAVGQSFNKADIPLCALTMTGLYHMAGLYLPEDVYSTVSRPDHPSWFDAFADLGREAPENTALLTPFIVFPPELEFLNRERTGLEAPRDIRHPDSGPYYPPLPKGKKPKQIEASDKTTRTVPPRDDPRAIRPAERFAGRFEPKDLKELQKNVGEWTDHADTPEKLNQWMQAAWERYKDGESGQGVKGVVYTAPSLDDVFAHMEQARREREASGASYEDPAKALQRAKSPRKSRQEWEELAERTDKAMQAAPGGSAFSLPPKELEDFLDAIAGKSWQWTILDLALRQTLETGELDTLRRGMEETLRYSYAGYGLHRRAQDMPSYFVLEHSSRPERSLWFDHGRYRGQLLLAYACGRPDLARRFFPREIGPCTAGLDRYGSLMVNLCMAIMYDDAQWKIAALEDASVYRKQTKALYERAFVDYFAALAEHDPETMNLCLTTLAQGTPKLMWFRDFSNKRVFNTQLHGMYAFAAVHLPPATFARLTRPTVAWWWDDYADLLLEAVKDGSNAACSKPLYPFSGEPAFVNAMLCAIDYPRKQLTCEIPGEEPVENRQTGQAPSSSGTDAGSGLWRSLKGLFRK